MLTPSLNRSPLANVLEQRSDPAKSTKLNFDVVTDFLHNQVTYILAIILDQED